MDIIQLYRIAKMYFLDGMRQGDIAAVENLSRSQISRLLSKAKEQGIVQVDVSLPATMETAELSMFLENVLSLDHVRIVSVPASITTAEKINESIAIAAVDYLPALMRRYQTVGLGWGRTMYQMSTNMSYHTGDCETTFVPLVGSAGFSNPNFQINFIIDRVARKLKGRYVFTNISAIQENSVPFSRIETKQMHILQQYWDKLDMVVFGLGSKNNSDIYLDREVSDEYMEKVQEANVLGEILTQFFDQQGRVVNLNSDYNHTACNIQKLKKAKHSICLAGGKEKAESLLVAARAGFFNELITDSNTAQLIYKMIRREE